MAEAIKCDRCGEFFITNSEHKTNGRIHGGIIAGVATHDGETYDAWFDLCDNCLSDFLKFMRGDRD